jgi:hypothetical protein
MMLAVEIQVKGQLDADWSTRLESLSITSFGENTTISGSIRDQAALYGLVERLSSLGLQLVSVQVKAK